MHFVLTDASSEAFLLEELRRGFPDARHDLRAPGLIATDLRLKAESPPTLAFARQFLPQSQEHQAASINAWGDCLLEAVTAGLPDSRPWRMHLVPHYGVGTAGQNRCQLIREALRERLRRKHRQRLRALVPEPAPFSALDSLVQLLLLAPDRGIVSVAAAPIPFEFRRVISPFQNGEIPPAVDKTAPSRAFAKLLEAEQRLGCSIAPGESCIDLGACPGSWSYAALKRGARVLAVDRSPLRDDLMRHPRLEFHEGDAFGFEPASVVDWLLCDVIAAPARSIGLLLEWARQRWMRRFVVTIKFKGREDYAALDPLKHALPLLCAEFYLTRLCANKNEACAFGILSGTPPTASPISSTFVPATGIRSRKIGRA